ncbi:MAG: hypothetical protein VX346_03570 [Planctomycetota bacterium]|nr:hypothetical protein [Planctomycetota bacterium]
MIHLTRIAAFTLVLGGSLYGTSRGANAQEAQEIFERRIVPIFKSPEPSSCVQCHLSAVDLKDYIHPSQERTFASLRDQGLVDLANPENSKILRLIRRGDNDLDKGARLIHQTLRRAEYEAFAAWIKACCNDPTLRNLPALLPTERARPQPDEIIRHARKSRVVDSFIRNVWSQRLRCFPCHTKHELDANNPQHKKPLENLRKLEAQFGKGFGDRLNLFRETPAKTVAYLIERSRQPSPGELPLLNLENPRESLLVLKPTSKLPPPDESGQRVPTYTTPVFHMGGLKMFPDDFSYKSFVSWIQDYASVTGNKYTRVNELPLDNWYPTQQVLRVRPVPKTWEQQTRVQLVVYAWNPARKQWSTHPIAFTQNSVTPRGIVGGPLFAFATKGAKTVDWTDTHAVLRPGKYLVKAYVDSSKQLAQDPIAMLGAADLAGQAEIKARWRVGLRKAERIKGDQFMSAATKLRPQTRNR